MARRERRETAEAAEVVDQARVSTLMGLSGEFQAAPSDVEQVIEYLSFYGYLPSNLLALGTVSASTHLSPAIAQLQSLANLPPTGELDALTIELLRQPRCGCPDVLSLELLSDPQPLIREMTACVIGYVPNVPKSVQDDIWDTCFRNWMEVADLKLKRTLQQAGASLVITSRNLGGPSGVLAQCHVGPYRGQQLQLDMDSSEGWNTEVGMEEVGTHELGHFCGLMHSKGLMAPFYRQGLSKPQQVDDIPRIQAIWGKPVAGPTPPPQPTPPDPTPVPSGFAKHFVQVEVVCKDLHSAKVVNIT